MADSVARDMGRANRWAICCVLAAVTLALACASKQDILVSKLRGRGNAHVYPVTFDQAWSISEAIFRLEPTETIEEHRPDGYILTSQNTAGLSAGTYMGVFIEPGERTSESKVTFISRRKTPTQSYPALNEATFHKKFTELLSLIGAVGPLPKQGGNPDAGLPPDAGPALDGAPPPEAGGPSE